MKTLDVAVSISAFVATTCLPVSALSASPWEWKFSDDTLIGPSISQTTVGQDQNGKRLHLKRFYFLSFYCDPLGTGSYKVFFLSAMDEEGNLNNSIMRYGAYLDKSGKAHKITFTFVPCPDCRDPEKGIKVGLVPQIEDSEWKATLKFIEILSAEDLWLKVYHRTGGLSYEEVYLNFRKKSFTATMAKLLTVCS